MSKLLSHYATNQYQVGFCRQVITRHSCHSQGNLALLCQGRAATKAATVQTYSTFFPTKKTVSIFQFPFASVRGMPSESRSIPGKRRINRSVCKRSSKKLERTAISAFFLDRARRASDRLTVHCCDRSWLPRKCKGVVCLASSFRRFRVQPPIYRDRDLPEMFTETCSFKQAKSCTVACSFTLYSRLQMFLSLWAKLRSWPSAVHAERFSFFPVSVQSAKVNFFWLTFDLTDCKTKGLQFMNPMAKKERWNGVL